MFEDVRLICCEQFFWVHGLFRTVPMSTPAYQFQVLEYLTFFGYSASYGYGILWSPIN